MVYYARAAEHLPPWELDQNAILRHLAAEDAEVMASMDEGEWWLCFWAGWGSVAP